MATRIPSRSSTPRDTTCPCLVSTPARRREAFPLLAYCRPGEGRVRVPTRDELATLCTAGRYRECPGYRRWKASRAWGRVFDGVAPAS